VLPSSPAGSGQTIDAPARVEIRQADVSDYDGLRDFLTGLSLRTRYLRFFAGVMPVTPPMLRRLVGAAAPGNYVDVLVAIEDGTIIGHGMASDTSGSSGGRATEMGVVVADGRQRRGVGSALMRALAARARVRGVTVVMMEVLAENQQMLTMAGKQFPTARHDRSGPYVTIQAPLPQIQEESPREPRTRTGRPRQGDQLRQPGQPGQFRQPGPVRERRVPGRAGTGLPVG
jgi:ribosomal protein S18 acetylase RimI-like enzyme